MTPKEVLAFCREKDVKAVDLRFMDFPGIWQHFTIPVDKLNEDVFEEGLGFDGSSIRGWQAINESDMLVVPQPETAALDPFTHAAHPVDDLQHPGSRSPARITPAIPRNVARKAVNYLKSTGIGDTCLHRARSRSSSFSTTSATIRPPTAATSSSTASRASGTAAARSIPTWATRSATRKAISRFRRPTR